MKEEKIILQSDDIVIYRTNIRGWVNQLGHYFGENERAARWDGCTHIKCEACGEIYRKSSYCRSCHHKKAIERYKAMPKKKWDGTGMVYSDREDKYFESWEEVKDFMDDSFDGKDAKAEHLRLIICDPIYPNEIDGDDYYSDFLPEDQSLYDVDAHLSGLIEEVNKYIREEKPIFSYQPGKYAVDLEGE
jgi:hypothetical protein